MYGKKTFKKPFKKTYKKGRSTSKKYKRTFKSNYGLSVIKAPVMSRETYAKLSYVRTFQTNIAQSSAVAHVVLGNSLIPMPADYFGTVTVGDIWASGVFEYSNFYNNYKVLACKINVQATAINANNVLRMVMIPVMCGGEEGSSGGTVQNRLNELNGFSYDTLAQQPFAQSRTLGIGTGGNATVFMKAFRKTKHMLAIRDTRDALFALDLPNPDGRLGAITCNSDSSWFYYIRIFNTATASAQSVEVEIRCSYFCQFQGRVNYTPLVVPPPV